MTRAFVPGKVLSCSLLAIGLATLLSLEVPAQQTNQPPSPPPGAPPAQPPSQPQPPPAPPAAQGNPLDEPIGWLTDARRNFTQGVRNYTCTLIKREKIRGNLQDTNIIMFSAKVQPFSIYMKWVQPHKLAGQEVAYVQGRNRNMMRVKAKGLVPGAIGFVSVDPNDRRVMEHSRHNILEAGLGNMIEENLKILQVARGLNKTAVRTAEYMFDKRPCLRIETVNPPERNPQYYCYRSVLYLEKESKLPMRLENYDWPAAPGAAGDLLEEFSYADLRFNVDMREDLFNK
jgi:Protein of unknown function (DUF1571)